MATSNAYVKKIQRIYAALFDHFGKQYWWPGRTRTEIIVGVLLTQNTAWTNVEKAIKNLRTRNLLSLSSLAKVHPRLLARAIRPAGYFNIKTKRLKNLVGYLAKRSRGNLSVLKRLPCLQFRQELLGINGVGPETADSILLYAFEKPVFVVDTYTKRIFSRLNLLSPDASYEETQTLFMDSLKSNAALFNEYHALIVRLGKDYCRKNSPRCVECPLKNYHCLLL